MINFFNLDNSVKTFISYIVDLIISIIMIHIKNKRLNIILIYISFIFKIILL